MDGALIVPRLLEQLGKLAAKRGPLVFRLGQLDAAVVVLGQLLRTLALLQKGREVVERLSVLRRACEHAVPGTHRRVDLSQLFAQERPAAVETQGLRQGTSPLVARVLEQLGHFFQ